jgi:hypothetical protein
MAKSVVSVKESVVKKLLEDIATQERCVDADVALIAVEGRPYSLPNMEARVFTLNNEMDTENQQMSDEVKILKAILLQLQSPIHRSADQLSELHDALSSKTGLEPFFAVADFRRSTTTRNLPMAVRGPT